MRQFLTPLQPTDLDKKIINNFFFSAPGGDLQTLIDGDLVPLEGDVVHFVRQLVEGLVYLHERNIAHLDIKVSSTHKRSMQTCHASLRILESVSSTRRLKFPCLRFVASAKKNNQKNHK